MSLLQLHFRRRPTLQMFSHFVLPLYDFVILWYDLVVTIDINIEWSSDISGSYTSSHFIHILNEFQIYRYCNRYKYLTNKISYYTNTNTYNNCRLPNNNNSQPRSGYCYLVLPPICACARECHLAPSWRIPPWKPVCPPVHVYPQFQIYWTLFDGDHL